MEAQESAGFYEGDERVALGGLFNNMLFFSTLVSGGNEGDSEPQGKLKEAIDKKFTDFNGFKEAFKKSVQSRYLCGWVWLALLNDGSGNLIIA